MPGPAPRRFALHVHISVMLTILLLVTGIVLGLFHYRQTTRIILSSSQSLFAQIEQQVTQDLRQTFAPKRHMLALLALDPAATSSDPSQRLALLKPFSQALLDNPDLAALYVGYGNGDFFMVRPLRSAALQNTFHAPARSAYQVWSIERSTTMAPRSLYRFYDADLNLLEQRISAGDRYDPRRRPWYEAAMTQSGDVTTAPYVFFSSHQVGTTLARALPPQAVIGADLTLDALSQALAAHRVTPDTQVVIYDSGGNAVAYPDSQRLIQQDDTVHLARAVDLNPVLARLLTQTEAGSGHLQSGRRDWIVSRQHIGEGGPGGLNLALLVPEDQLLGDAYRLRWQGALVTLTVLLLCLPFGWLASRLLVRPLRALRREARTIRQLDFSTPIERRSAVLEVDDLSLAMRSMKQTLANFIDSTSRLGLDAPGTSPQQRLLSEALRVSQAQAGVLYWLDAGGEHLEPAEAQIGGTLHDGLLLGLPRQRYDALLTPSWLWVAEQQATCTTGVGYDQAVDLRPLMLRLDSPRLDIVAVALSNRLGERLGTLVLLHRDTGSTADLEQLDNDQMAFVKAVCGMFAGNLPAPPRIGAPQDPRMA